MLKKRQQVVVLGAFALLFFVPHLCGVGYTFLKQKGIPAQLIPKDCLDGEVSEATKLTPTQAHLYAWYKTNDFNLSEFKVKIEPYLDVIEQILVNERVYAQTHYMFYHAQNGSFRFLQDFLKVFYALLSIEVSLTGFEFLRLWHDALPVANVNKFLDDERKTIEDNWWFDGLPDIRNKLLSVNLSLFGSVGVSGSYTFDYFQNSFSYMSFDIEWIAESIKKVLGLQLTKDECELLQSLFSKMDCSGSLFQIGIPHEQVDRCVYLSHRLGIPYKEEVVAACYDESKKRHIRISDVLDEYVGLSLVKDNFDLINKMQARILLSQDIMLNPSGGVQLFRFTHVDNQDMYQEELMQFVRMIAVRYLVQTNFLGKKDMPFNRLATMIFNK